MAWRGFFIKLGPILLLAALALGSQIPAYIWSLNHLRYLSPEWMYFASTSLLCACLVSLLPRKVWFSVTEIGRRIRLPALVCISGSVLLLSGLAFLLPVGTFFMGDGYQLLSHFAAVSTPPLKWTETGSILIVRGLQSVLGTIDEHSAILAFRIISIGCGIFYFVMSCLLAKAISDAKRTQWMTALFLYTTGALALFLGYVEFYPLTWAVGVAVFYFSIRAIRFGRSIIPALLAVGLGVAVHLQILTFLPGVIFLIGHRLYQDKWSTHIQRRWPLYGGGVVILAIICSAILQQRLQFVLVFLPFFSGRPDSPDYAVFTVQHILDLMNLAILVAPGLAALLLIPRRRVGHEKERAVTRFLAATALGTCLFALLIDPAFGIAIDWDLMSIALLPLTLLIVQTRAFEADKDWPMTFILVGLLSVTTMVLFAATLSSTSAGEKRFTDLLDYYKKKSRSGWTILTNYYLRVGDEKSVHSVRAKFLEAFPEDKLLWDARTDIEHRRYDEAIKKAKQLLSLDPLRADVHQLAAEAYGASAKYDLSLVHYDTTIALRPYDSRLKNDLGLVLIEAGQYERAIYTLTRVWESDRTLFTAGEGLALAYIRKGELAKAEAVANDLEGKGDEAGAHLIRMVVCVTRGDMFQGQSHFERFKSLGKERGDYRNILDYYGQYWP